MSEKRDPRANWLDEDPFEKMNNNSKTHTRARDDGNWRKPHIRVVTGSAGQPFFLYLIPPLKIKEFLYIKDRYGIFLKLKRSTYYKQYLRLQ